MGNLKSAPLPLTGDIVAKLTGDLPAYGRGIVQIPVVGTVGQQDRPEKLDPRTIPSSMEQLAASWAETTGDVA